MSKISIQGAATGTGVFTISSPATNTDRTLTLPDEAGTVLTSASTANFPAGSVLQVVQTVKTDTFSTTVQDTTFVDITGLSASITPISAASTILVLASIGKCSCTTSNRSVNFRLDRSGTLIALGDVAGDRVRISFAGQAGGYDAAGRGGQSASLNFLDSPASTSALTYKIQMSGHNGEATVINRSGEDLTTADSQSQGFIAHELQEVCPSAVTGEKDAVNEDGSIKPQGIDTSFLVATLTAAIQEQQAIIDEQKTALEALTARVSALEQA